MARSLKAGFLAELINGECSDENISITNFSSLFEAKEDSVTFFNDHKFRDQLSSTNAGVVILSQKDKYLCRRPTIVVSDPYLAYAKIASIFHEVNIKREIHNTSITSKDCKIGSEVCIEAYAVIGENSIIGDNTIIGANSYLGKNVLIGKNVTIHPNVYIADFVKIGDNCNFFSGAKIGVDGFGYAREANKSWIKIPQTGSVVIGNNVDIGGNSTIDRGALENTIIEDGVKIDNLVQIGHNCHIGENTIIAGCAGIAGSTKIGKNCMIGGAAMIKGHITIADDTIISGGTGIGKNVENPGKRFTNIFPYNLEHKDWLRIANNLKKLGKKND
jgi:UDP-3-O-[3-hydroxymyristoyl] glucosamine N-acyltransferase